MKQESEGASARHVIVALVAITMLAFVLRWPLVHRLLPELPEPDAFLVMHAQALRDDPAILHHQVFDQRYPMLLTRVLQILPEARVEPGLPSVALEQAALAAAARPYVQGRVVVLLFSLLLVPLTWLVARRFAHDRVALVAAFFVATSLLHALFSTQARPHGAHASLALLAVWSASRLVGTPSRGRIVVALISASLAIACLQSGLFTLPPLGLALLLSGGSPLWRIAKATILPLAAACAAFWAYPVLPRIDATGVHLGGAGSHDFFFAQFNLKGLSVAGSWLLGHDPVLLATTLLGLACAVPWLVHEVRALIAGKHGEIAVALAYVLPYLSLIAVSEEIYDRFLLPLLPWCAIVSAVGIERVLDLLANVPALHWARSLSRLLFLALLALPVVVLVQFARVSLAPNTLEQSAAWLRAHEDASRGRIVASPYLALPVLFDASALDSARGDHASEDNVWLSWQSAHRIAPAGMSITMFPTKLAVAKGELSRVDDWLAAFDPEWAVLEVSRKTNAFPAPRRLHEWVEAHGELAFRSPGVAPRSLEIGLADYQSVENMAQRLFSMSAFGPTIEIWRIRR